MSLLQPFNQFLDRVTDQRIADYTARYATPRDGRVDNRLAGHIELELKRRKEMGKILDIYEPLANMAIVAPALTICIGLARQAMHGGPVFSIKTLLATTALTGIVQLGRMPVRFLAGLRGGLDVALAMDSLEKSTQERTWQERVTQPAPVMASMRGT